MQQTIYHSNLTKEEITNLMVSAASVVKLICGIGNNAAWMVVLHAYSQAKKCQRYNRQVKHQFKQCIEMYHRYERKLIYATNNRMFHLEDMTPEIRKKYGDITDRQYYDMWSQTGIEAWTRTKPIITSLWNKYRLSLVKHNVKDADHVAWVMTAMAALELACNLYREAINDCHKGMGIPKSVLEYVFGQFSFEGINKKWMEAMIALAPDTEGYELDPIEDRNISIGLEQLCDEWIDTDLMFSSTMDAIQEHSEVFRTKGELKKAIREVAEARAETNANKK